MTDTETTREGDKAVITPAGDMVVATLAPLRAAMRAQVDEGVRELVVDLTNTRMVDSSGLGLLAAAHNSLEKTGGRLAVVNVSSEVRALFQAVRMHQHFSVTGD